jgi:hypothetical protein
MNLAAHATHAICPRCNRRVRSGVEIQAAAADVQDLLEEVAPLQTSASEDDQDIHDVVTSLMRHFTQELRAELVGEHLDCVAPDMNDVVALARSRAAEIAAHGAALHS